MWRGLFWAMLGPRCAWRLLLIVAGMTGLLATSSPAGAASPRFVAKGNAVCAAFYGSMDRVPQPDQRSWPAMASFLRRGLPIDRAFLQGLRGLVPPAADRQTF